MTGGATSSATRKFRRGVEQVKTLLDEAEQFEAADAYTHDIEVDHLAEREAEVHLYVTQLRSIPEDWSLLAGEAIQNLRACLDHAVYAASSDEWRARSSFPITSTERSFETRGQGMLRGVTPELREVIRTAQPYLRTPQRPKADRLWCLRELSNIDKHRTLTTVATAVSAEYVGVPDGVNVTWTKPATGVALGPGRAHVSTFLAVSSQSLDIGQIEPGFSYAVHIERFPITFLKGIAHRVFEVLVECETGKRISPFATYPI